MEPYFLRKKIIGARGKMKNVNCGVEGEKEEERERKECVCAGFYCVLSDTGAGVHQRPCYNKDWVINNVHVVSGLNNVCFQRC